MSLLGGTAIPVLADDDQTITMWTVFTGSDGDILREIVKDYNESNEDGIKVDIDIMDGSNSSGKTSYSNIYQYSSGNFVFDGKLNIFINMQIMI